MVGAPQYFEKDGDVGGAVYIYINRAGGRDWNDLEHVRLHGNKDSMFGLAVESIGDVNQDGFQGQLKRPCWLLLCMGSNTIKEPLSPSFPSDMMPIKHYKG